nr:hypothetical protein [Tanacetum cinerariifolium]
MECFHHGLPRIAAGGKVSLVTIPLEMLFASIFERTHLVMQSLVKTRTGLVLDVSNRYPPLTVDDMAWVSGLSSLEHLNLNNVDLSGAQKVDSLLYIIPSLLELSLSSFPVMPNLLELDLSFNMLKHVGIWRQCHLQELIVSDNRLQEEMLGSTTNVSECSHGLELTQHLRGNYLNGSLSESLGRLTNLRDLDLSDNNLADFLGKPSKHFLAHNQFNGSIPESLRSLTGLKELLLQSNQLTGPIPASLARLVSLQRLSMSSDLLNGMIPTSFGQLSRLN